MTIYFFTIPFYHFFFAIDPDNFFFFKQSGLFLFLIGLFYLIPFFDLQNSLIAIVLTIFSKITAVFFLIANSSLTPAPSIIHLAAFGDGLMATAIVIFSLKYYRK